MRGIMLCRGKLYGKVYTKEDTKMKGKKGKHKKNRKWVTVKNNNKKNGDDKQELQHSVPIWIVQNVLLIEPKHSYLTSWLKV